MINDSRREFFKTFVPKGLKQTENSNDQNIVTIGHLAIFPVYTKSKIRIKNLLLTVESLPEGLRLRSDETNKNYKLSLNNGGLVQVHLSVEWPEAAVLSFFTGEIYNL